LNPAPYNLELDPDTLPVVISFTPGATSLELGAQVTKTSYDSKQDLDDTLSFLAATVRAAHSAGVADAERKSASGAGAGTASRGTERGSSGRGGGRGGHGGDRREDYEEEDEVHAETRDRDRRREGGGGGGGGGGRGRDSPTDRRGTQNFPRSSRSRNNDDGDFDGPSARGRRRAAYDDHEF